MVQVPTADQIARSSTRSGRIAPSGPSVSVGSGMADAGRGLQQAAYNLADLATQERIDGLNKRSNDVSTNLTRFLASEEQRFLAAREGSTESGIGFTRKFMEDHQARANAFAKENFEGLSPDAQTKYLNSIIGAGNTLYTKATDFETAIKGAYYDRTTNEGLDTYRTQIRNNAADFDTLKRQGIEQIRSADMPEPWKAERIAAWESDAAESKWRWEFQKNPEKAIAAISGPSGIKNVIRNEEGFRSEPYWDVNAWRIGYGSDTITLPDGSQQKVRPGMKITREDAERDLEYRLNEREGAKAREQVGARWNELGAGTQAALASVAYNYGSLPSSVAQAARTGNAEAIAQAIEVLPANPDRRKREAALVRGTGGLQLEDEYADIPFDRRQQLFEEGARTYEQQQADAIKAQNARLASIEGAFKLGIATGDPGVTEKTILESPLTDSDKAGLINSLNTKRTDERTAASTLARIESGGAFDIYDSDDKKGVGLAYDAVVGDANVVESGEAQDVLRYMMERSRIVPQTASNQIRSGILSNDPKRVAASSALAYQMVSSDRGAVSAAPNGTELIDAATTFDHLTQTLGLSPEDAGQRMIDMRDPAKRREREALLETKAVKDALKNIDDGNVADIFDPGIFSFAPSVGETDAARAAIVSDYKDIMTEMIVEAGGDMDLAEKLAADRFSRVYNVSKLNLAGDGVIVKYPPEVAYPAGADGTHEYIRNQALQALSEDGYEGVDEIALEVDPDGMTEADIKAGRPAKYILHFKRDGAWFRHNLPFFAIPEAQADTPDLSGNIRRMESNRSAEANRQRIIEGGAGQSPIAEMATAGREAERLTSDGQSLTTEKGKDLASKIRGVIEDAMTADGDRLKELNRKIDDLNVQLFDAEGVVVSRPDSLMKKLREKPRQRSGGGGF